jgi:hypothetical protein
MSGYMFVCFYFYLFCFILTLIKCRNLIRIVFASLLLSMHWNWSNRDGSKISLFSWISLQFQNLPEKPTASYIMEEKKQIKNSSVIYVNWKTILRHFFFYFSKIEFERREFWSCEFQDAKTKISNSFQNSFSFQKKKFFWNLK